MITLMDAVLEAARAAVIHLEACEAGRIVHPFKSASLPLLRKLIERVEKEMGWVDVSIPFGPSYDDSSGEFKEADSMHKRGLIAAGVLIEMEDGHTFLIGHVNELAGTCDDCSIGKDSVVKRYKVVWVPPKPPEEPYRRDPRKI